MPKPPYTWLLIIICLSTIVNISALRKGHSWADDSALYIAQSKSIVEGTTAELLAQNIYAMSHSTFPIGPDLAPWGLPIILSPIYALFGLNFLLMKLAGIMFFELSLVVLFHLFIGRVDNILTLSGIGFFAFHPLILLLNDHILSDVPYLFFSLVSILLIDRFIVRNKLPNFRSFRLILIGFFIFVTYSIRFIGVVLLVLLFTVQIVSTIRLHHKNFLKSLIFDLSFFLPYLTFAVLEFLMYLSLPYAFSTQASMLRSPNIDLTITLIKNYMNVTSEFFGQYYPLIIYITTIPFVLSGLYKSFKENYVYAIYTILTLTVLVSIPFYQGIRYLIPIFPFFIYYLCSGLQNSPLQFPLISRYLTGRIKLSYIYMAVITCMVCSYSIRNVYANLKNEHVVEGIFSEKSQEMLNFLSNNTNKNDIIVFFKPRFITLLTERQSIMISDFAQILLSDGNYVVLYKPAGNYNQIAPAGKDYSQMHERFPIVFENEDFTIFHLKGRAGDH
jgi:hypothetical protein